MSNELEERKVYLDFTPAILDITNFNELEAEVTKYAERYHGLTFDRSEKKGAEQARMELLALHNALEEQRKHIKRVYNQPLNDFEEKIKSLTKVISVPLDDIREGLKEIEDAEKAEREDALNRLLESKCNEVGLSVEDVEKSSRWLNKGQWTTKLNPTAKLEEEIDFAIKGAIKKKEQRKVNEQVVQTFCETAGTDPEPWLRMLDYKSPTDIMQEIQDIQKAEKERVKQQEEKRKEYEEYQKKQKEAMEEAQHFAEEVEEEQVFTSVIRVTGTASKLSLLNDFIVAHGIGVEEVADPLQGMSEDDLPW